MSMNPREYRDYLYRHGVHPQGVNPNAESDKSSFTGIYLTLFPFMVLEYFLELHYHRLPSGIAFPLGYVLFWAFYYTYYQPGFLESKLSHNRKWDLLSIPTVLLGAVIWFTKILVVELFEKVILRSLLGLATEKKKAEPPKQKFRAHANPNYVRPPSTGLPREIENALAILGLKDCRDWQAIHRRYRELAKKFHPDLNPEITQVGNRFMIYDAAYRKLEAVREKYFPTKSP